MLCNGSKGQKLSRAPGMHLNGRDLSGGHQRGATLPPEQRKQDSNCSSVPHKVIWHTSRDCHVVANAPWQRLTVSFSCNIFIPLISATP